ncbi:MAG TPA: tyrosine--tRNA ligase [Solirubrobacteraceae bacterium]|jgi:tyrosyl-tRNA synthetase|nr:tyrosine--tRNA ligase [Solirubrobacteraceae bacterium]
MDSDGEQAAETAAWLGRNAVDSLPAGALAQKLERANRPLRVKLGIDPTAPDIHLGHTVVLQKLREFQDRGHTVVLIIGDYTARVGDPSGRSATRPVLADAEIDANARTFQAQATKVLDPERLEVRFNSEWLDMSMSDLFRLLATSTVAQVTERDDFAKRLASGSAVSMLELLYPLLQGYDSVAVRADVELGGTDQKFNLLLARDIQRAYGVAEQAVLTMPILPGTDGVQRMSKSLGNYIGVTDPPGEMYGKTLSIPDAALPTWYSLLIGSAPPADLGPRDAKRALARALVARFHDPAAAIAAEEEFDRVHVRHERPDEVPELEWRDDGSGVVHLPALLRQAFGVSSSEARRAIAQGGVRIDGEAVAADRLDLASKDVDGRVLQFGKRRFVRVRLIR